MSHLDDAMQLYHQGRFAEAEPLLASCTRDPATRPQALYGLGLIRFAMGAYTQAEALLMQCITEGPDNLNALYYLAHTRFRLDDPQGAIARCAHVLTREPTHAGALRLINELTQTAVPDVPHRTPPPTPVHPPQPPISSSSTVGIASNVRQQPVPWRGRPAAQLELTFRVDMRTPEGTTQGLTAVELRGHEIRGSVQDGDWVELTELPCGSDAVIKSFRNLTTGQTVSSKNHWVTAQ